MSRTLTRILGAGSKADSGEYHAMVESSGRPQMGFAITRASGAMDGFLYHSLDNIRFLERDGCGSACKKNPVSGVIGVQKGTTIPMV